MTYKDFRKVTKLIHRADQFGKAFRSEKVIVDHAVDCIPGLSEKIENAANVILKTEYLNLVDEIKDYIPDFAPIPDL